jgi:hypothetical protein
VILYNSARRVLDKTRADKLAIEAELRPATWIVERAKPVQRTGVGPRQERRIVAVTETVPRQDPWIAVAIVDHPVEVIESAIAALPPAGREATALSAEEVRAEDPLAQAVPEVPPALAVVVAVVDGAVVVAAEEGVSGGENVMNWKGFNMKKQILLIVALAFSFTTLALSGPRTGATTSAKESAQKTFATPQEALGKLVQATAAYDISALLQIFGPDGEDFIASADPVQDKNNGRAFAELARQKSSIQTKANKATIIVGENDWPFPVPLVKQNGKWVFDSKAGRNELLYRRIGSNELDAIQVCRGYVEAQNEYALTIHDNSGINQYAQKIISTSGKQDGLFWQTADGTPGGPISEGVAKAIEEGYSADKKSAYHGYYFKILKGQGPAAPLGRLDYVIQGAMIGGFALIAAPAEYRVTGVKTFLVSQDGVVYQKDLGPDTLDIAKKIELFDPDKTWQPTFDQWPESAQAVAAK